MGNGAHPWRVHSLPGRGSLPSRSWTHSGGVQVLPVSTGPTFPRWGRFSHPREVGTLSVSVFPPRSQIPQFRTRKILRTGVRALRFGRKKSALRVASRLPPRCEAPWGAGGPPPPSRSCRPRQALRSIPERFSLRLTVCSPGPYRASSLDQFGLVQTLGTVLHVLHGHRSSTYSQSVLQLLPIGHSG